MAETTGIASKLKYAIRSARLLGIALHIYVAAIKADNKWCIRCRRFHSLEEFGIDRHARDGRTPMCRASWRVAVKRYRKTRGTTGMRMSDETRAKMSAAHQGERNHLWKGGITHATRQARKQAVYQQWRREVMKIDGMACVQCGSTELLEAHHIKPYRTYPELATVISNGLTLCAVHHRTIHLEARNGR